MKYIKKLISSIMLLVLVAILTACTPPTRESREDVAGSERYPILEVLPRHIEGFSYKGMRVYPDPWGYSLRYGNDSNQGVYADIYLYPVPQELRGREQEDIVMNKTNEALEEIDYFKRKGVYSAFEVISRDAFEILGNKTSEVEIQLVRDNLALYSLLFVTESKGKLIKARMTMPNNEANNGSEAWKRFVESVFTVILNNIDKA
jgi:hypothetical protein